MGSWAFGLVWLLCGFPTACEGAAVGLRNSSNKETFEDKKNEVRKGARVSYCGEKAFNPDIDSCCEAVVTPGLSKKVSTCCGQRAYDKLNEICCQSTVIPKPGPKAKCCGKGAFDEDIHLCCGKHNTVILQKNSSDHQCCGDQQFNTITECCCPVDNALKKLPKPSCCGKESGLHGRKPNNTPSQQIDCSQSTTVLYPATDATCCGKKAFNKDTDLCCGKHNTVLLTKDSSNHECCGDQQFNTITECCCPVDNALKKLPKPSCCGKESGLHGRKPNNTPSQQIDCSQSTAVLYPATDATCCGKKAFNKDTDLCCGKHNTVLLTKDSSNHECCGDQQFNTITECCCPVDNALKKLPKPSCCGKESGAPQQSPTPPPTCTEPKSSLCGSQCYNPKDQRCCDRSQKNSPWCCAPGRCNDAPSVYNPNIHICCDGCVSEWIPWKDQCCGETAYGFAQREVLCFHNTLFNISEDAEECCAIPFNPLKGTRGSHSHGSPGKHYCRTEENRPQHKISSDVQRNQETGRTYHCGRETYDITDPLMKCCAGTLHNMTGEHEGECCGSVLQKPQEVCCSSEDKEVLYKVKEAFQCCGHYYYNTSLWSCCAGKLSTVQHPCKGIEGSRLQSVNNVNDTHLCNKMYIGIVESVHQHQVVFSSVLIIHGRNATVTPLASPHILRSENRCTFPELTPGKIYFSDDRNVFADFDHDSILQSLRFILFKCYRP